MLRTLFILMILVPGTAAALVSRFSALLMYFWFSLFRPQEWLWIDITRLRLSLVLSLLVVIPRGWLLSDANPDRSLRQRLMQEAWPNLTHPLTIGMALFLGIAYVAQIGAFDRAVGWHWLDFLWRLILVCLVAVSLMDTRQRLMAVVAVVAASVGFHATRAGVASLLGGGVRYGEGLAGAFVDNNGWALGIVMTLPLFVVVSQNTARPWLRWLILACIAPSFYTVISTFSRGGFLAGIVSVVVFASLQKRRVASLALVACIGLLAFLVVPIPAGYFDRVETIATYEEVGESSALSRLHFWRVAIDMVRDRPLGVGLRNYDVIYDKYDFSGGRYGTGRSVHSSHFQVLAELGYAGFVTWAGLFGYAVLVCFRVRSRSRHPALSEDERRFYLTTADALLVSMAGFLVGGAFIALALNDLTWLTFALVATLDRLSAKAVAVDGLPKGSATGLEPDRVGPADLGTAFHGAYRQSPAGIPDAGAARRVTP
jgi:probable O-glycosylation ligase (exosortase A-associated)